MSGKIIKNMYLFNSNVANVLPCNIQMKIVIPKINWFWNTVLHVMLKNSMYL